MPFLVKFLPLIMGLSGIGARLPHATSVEPGLPARLAGQAGALYLFLLNKWYFDELYDFLFVAPGQVARLRPLAGGDSGVIDGFGPDGVAAVTLRSSASARRLQTGYLYHYAFAMLIGVAALVTWYLFRSR